MDSQAKYVAQAFEEEDFKEKLQAVTDETERKYVMEGREALKHFIQVVNQNEGWKYSETKEGVNIWKKRSTTGAQSIKAEGEIPFSADQILDFLLDHTEEVKYDSDMEDMKRLFSFPMNTILVNTIFKGRFMVGGRDFICVASHVKRADGTIMLAFKSVEHPDYPPVKKYVRGIAYIVGWIVKPKQDQPNICECLYLSEFSLRGKLPQILADIATKNQGHRVFKVREAMLKKYGI